MSKHSLVSLLGTSALALTGACVDTDQDDVDEATRTTVVGSGQALVLTLGPAGVVGQPPAPLVTDGEYQLASTLDVEAQALLPGQAYEAVQILEGLRDRPAQTLFDMAEAAGVPVVGTLRDALPGPIESRLYGWIDGYIQGVTTGDGTIAQVINTVLTAAHTDVAHVELASTLTITGSTAQHRLDTVTLLVAGQSLSYDVAPLAAIGAAIDVPVIHGISDTGALRIYDHSFEVPYGKIAWRAIQAQVTAQYGTDLRGLLGRQINCAAMAANVAGQCYLGQCVGHESDLNSICEAGLDYAVAQVQDRVEAATIEPLALDAGTGQMIDGDFSDRVCSMIDTGVWSARLDTGHGLRPAPASFTGTRN